MISLGRPPWLVLLLYSLVQLALDQPAYASTVADSNHIAIDRTTSFAKLMRASNLVSSRRLRSARDSRKAEGMSSPEGRASHHKLNMLTIWSQITTEFYGRRIYGSYVIEDGMLKVKTPRGEKGAQLGASNPDKLAERLLRELAAQGKA
jgi:hypothetical protein